MGGASSSLLWRAGIGWLAVVDLRRVLVTAVVAIALILRAVALIWVLVVVDAVLLLVVALAADSTEVVATMLLSMA